MVSAETGAAVRTTLLALLVVAFGGLAWAQQPGDGAQPAPAPVAAVDASALEGGAPSSVAGQVTLTDTLRPFEKSVRIREAVELDRFTLTCRGGRADVTWHVGNLEPTVPDTGIHLTLRFDGDAVATIMRGSSRGIWNDTPADLRAVVPCPTGDHELWIEVTSISGEWGIPYVVNPGDPTEPGLRVMRGFVVSEVS